MNSLKKLDMLGEINALLIPFVLVFLLLIGSSGFGYWAYMSRQDYKNNTDSKVAIAVQAANKQLTAQLDARFAQEEKSPYLTYNGPEAYGSVKIIYPKTWSAYAAVNDGSDTPLDSYFYPGAIPDITDQTNTYALRTQVMAQPYSQELQQYQAQAQGGQVTVKPYALPKLPNVVGVYLTGQVQDQKQGEMVLLPLRSQTLAIWTESAQFEGDFNNIILPNFAFSP